MSQIIRLAPEKPFPSYIFIPGQNPHPKKLGGHMEGEGDPIAEVIDPNHPEKNHWLRFALDLYNFEYYWESHVYFEALWNAHQRQGTVADFLKAMIKLGAAGVKFAIGQTVAGNGHFDRAIELFELVRAQEGDIFLGFNLKIIIDQTSEMLLSGNKKNTVTPMWI
jgi:hypothetical protein